MKENKYIKCEKCDSYMSLEQYEENEGVCKKCAKRQYPENCFDPRKDNRSWWTDPQVNNRTPANMNPVRCNYRRGYRMAE